MVADASARRVPSRRRVPHPGRTPGPGTIFGRTLRDARVGIVAMTVLLGGMILAGGASMASVYGTAEARLELARLSSSLPPVMTGLYGNPVKVDTLGGFVTWHYGAYLALLTGLWSLLALSATLADEARRGSLDLIAVSPVSRVRLALEKVAGHVTALAIMASLIGLATWLAGVMFARLPGDGIPAAAAFGFAAGIAVKGLLAGSVAFALASFVGRAAAAGLAGAIMLAGYVVTGYRAAVPAFDAIAGVSWFSWTAGHLPLADRWDWRAIALSALVWLGLMAVGVWAFARRDIGVTATRRLPAPPDALLGVRGPVRRSFGELGPMALAWGIGLGSYGLAMSAATRSFVAELQKIPSLAEIVRSMLPGIDMTTPAGFLQVLFVDFGFVLFGLAAATLVTQRWGDETTGRLELLLATPLTRARWVIASGVAVWAAIAVTTAMLALAIGVGVGSSGGEVAGPMAGTLVLALYGAALAGVGFAVGGVGHASLGGAVVAVLAVGTFLVDMLAPTLDLPDWVHQLALSAHLGRPMVGAWDPAGMGAALAIAVGGVLVGAWGMHRRDVAGR